MDQKGEIEEIEKIEQVAQREIGNIETEKISKSEKIK